MTECTMICLDNSEWMRNGDFSRTRFEAQHEGAHSVLGFKSQNPEATVGVISLAGGSNVGVQVLCSPTDEKIKVMRAFATAKIGGKADLATGLQVAQLALKYKPSHFKSRIVVFVGSPVEVEQKKLIKIAKTLKKNNVAVDVISMGEWEHNESILEEFVAAVNKSENSHLIVVPPGTFPEDAISASPIGGGNQFAEYGGVNPEMDPELAAAMQESLMLAQANASTQNAGGRTSVTAQSNTLSSEQDDKEEDDDEEAKMLAEAMAMSMQETQQANKEESKESTSEDNKESAASALLDPRYLYSLVEDVGVDVKDPEIQKEIQRQLNSEEDGEQKKKKPKKDEEKDDSKE